MALTDIKMNHSVAMNKLERKKHFPQQFPFFWNVKIPFHFRLQGGRTKLCLDVEAAVFHPRLMVPDTVKGGRVGLIRQCGKCVNLMKEKV
jgi:hypothetical protein